LQKNHLIGEKQGIVLVADVSVCEYIFSSMTVFLFFLNRKQVSWSAAGNYESVDSI